MFKVCALAVAATLLVLPGSGFAAVLETAGSGVLVNKGKGFVPASAGINLPPGTRILVRGPHAAELRLTEECGCDRTNAARSARDCERRIQAGRVYTIPSDPHCESDQNETVGLLTAGAAAAAFGAGLYVLASENGRRGLSR